MVTKVPFFLALLGVIYSSQFETRRCDPEQPQQTPTVCSNYKNTEYLKEQQNKLDDKQGRLELKINMLEGELKEFNVSLERAKKELEKLNNQTENEHRKTKAQLQENKDGIASLKKDVADLVKYKERVGGNFTELEKKLDATGKQLRGNEVSLKNLETDTKAALNDTLRLLNQYKTELSHLNTTTHKLGVRVEARLNDTKTELEAKLTEIQKNSEDNAKVAFSASLTESSDVFTGPATDTRKELIFDKVFTNIGGAYNCKTGIFTAPKKGVYHFSYMTFGYSWHISGAILLKNGHLQVSTYEFKGHDRSDITSNTVILELNVGETVNIILWTGGKVYSSVFSGFLVFPL